MGVGEVVLGVRDNAIYNSMTSFNSRYQRSIIFIGKANKLKYLPSRKTRLARFYFYLFKWPRAAIVATTA